MSALKSSSFWDAVESRRSIYALNNTLPVSDERVVELVNRTILNAPSSFNSQSARVLLLLNKEHEKFWDIVRDALIEKIGEEKFNEGTKQKIAMFKAGYGSILFFEDQDVVRGLQEKAPAYADRFPQWSEHTSAIHQFILWTALSQEGVGASLQHYNPLPDAEVKKTFNVPESWTLKAHLNFGGIVAPAGEKSFEPLEKRVVVHGAKKITQVSHRN